MKQKNTIIILMLLISKISFSQFYLEINQSYNMNLNKNNGLNIVNGSVYNDDDFFIIANGNNYTINNYKKEEYDTTKLNFAEGMYYGANIGYNFLKYFGVSVGYETMSSKYNPNFIQDKYQSSFYTSTQSSYYRPDTVITFLTNNYFVTIIYNNDTIHNYHSSIEKNKFLINIKNYYLKFNAYYLYKKIKLFGEVSLNYSKYNLIKNYEEHSVYINDVSFFPKEVITQDTIYYYYNYDKGFYYFDKTISNKTEYNFNKEIKISYSIGIEYLMSDFFSLLLKTSYYRNNIITYIGDEPKTEKFFYPTVRFDLGLRYTFGELKFGKNKKTN